ncbi:MAG: dihydrofolate reductase family protein [Ardenticatenaceae bacterium]|nr:dihydrofolate reductase family protein [Ardenticatenaceae bacterium]
MRKLTTFTIVSLNGCYKDERDGIGWHDHDNEGLELSRENLRADGTTLLFGRKTYEGFVDFWATDQAFTAFPEIAQRMADAEKVVFSKTLSTVSWKNARVAQNSLVEEVRQLKSAAGGGMTVLGSGEIVRQLAAAKLIDSYQFLVDPVIVARGSALFDGLEQTLQLTLLESRQLKNGAILLHYQTN